jgi:hypothetical protein
MTSWPAYVGLREKSAGMAAAYWAAWRTGTFDATGYATDVTRILRRHPGRRRPRPRATTVARRRVVTSDERVR